MDAVQTGFKVLHVARPSATFRNHGGGLCFNHRDSLVLKSHSLQHSFRVRFSNVSWSIYTSAVQTPNTAVQMSPLSIDLMHSNVLRWVIMSYQICLIKPPMRSTRIDSSLAVMQTAAAQTRQLFVTSFLLAWRCYGQWLVEATFSFTNSRRFRSRSYNVVVD